MLNDFFIFVAPVLTIVIAICISVFIALKDDAVRDDVDSK